MKWNGPDSFYSWVVAVACCFINMVFFGFVRISGILFVASVTRFGVQRQDASFPYTLATVMRNLIGPLVGYFAFRIGIRCVTIFGIVLAAAGAGLCYFAENIQVVTILWGVVFGTGFGFGNSLLAVIINQYFEVYRTTASGISHSGGCIGSFILPPIVEVLMQNYGLSGTYLFLAGFILNCIPAALFFKEPNFKTKSFTIHRQQPNERQIMTSGLKTRFYTTENDSANDKATIERKMNVSIIAKEEIKNNERHTPQLTYEERMKRLSTQTLLSNYSIRMSNSEPLDVEQIIENSKGRRHVDQTLVESEIRSLSSHNTDQDSEKDEVFAETDFRSSSVQYEKCPFPFTQDRASSTDYTFYQKENDCLDKQSDEVFEARAFQKNFDILNDPEKISNFTSKMYDKDSVHSSSQYDYGENSNTSNKRNPNLSPGQSEIATGQGIIIDINQSRQNEKPMHFSKISSNFGSFDVIFDPVFLLIAVTHGVNTFNLISMMTIIVDFAKDLQVESSKQKYILMLYSVADFVGRLGLGCICDRGITTVTTFTAVCFACQGLVSVVMTWSNGFIPLTTFMILFGLAEAGITIVFPVAMAEYIDREKQTIAIPTSSICIAPFLLAVSPLIGYFRDRTGTYIPIFYILGILSAASCVSWILLPCVARRRKRCKDDS